MINITIQKKQTKSLTSKHHEKKNDRKTMKNKMNPIQNRTFAQIYENITP